MFATPARDGGAGGVARPTVLRGASERLSRVRKVVLDIRRIPDFGTYSTTERAGTYVRCVTASLNLAIVRPAVERSLTFWTGLGKPAWGLLGILWLNTCARAQPAAAAVSSLRSVGAASRMVREDASRRFPRRPACRPPQDANAPDRGALRRRGARRPTGCARWSGRSNVGGQRTATGPNGGTCGAERPRAASARRNGPGICPRSADERRDAVARAGLVARTPE